MRRFSVAVVRRTTQWAQRTPGIWYPALLLETRAVDWWLRRRRLLDAQGAEGVSVSARRLNIMLKCCGPGAKYLEIGVQHGRTIAAVRANQRCAVDPSPVFSLRDLPPGISVARCQSADFFSRNVDRFDVVFLDGERRVQAFWQDLVAALSGPVCARAVLVDGIRPVDAASAQTSRLAAWRSRARSSGLPLATTAWHGDIWKLLPILRELTPNLRLGVLADVHAQLVVTPPADGPIVFPDWQDVQSKIARLEFGRDRWLLEDLVGRLQIEEKDIPDLLSRKGSVDVE